MQILTGSELTKTINDEPLAKRIVLEDLIAGIRKVTGVGARRGACFALGERRTGARQGCGSQRAMHAGVEGSRRAPIMSRRGVRWQNGKC